MTSAEYLSIKKAADYIGVSPQTLRRWDEEGKLKPVRQPSSGYRYYRRSDLEPFRLEYRRAETAMKSPGELFQTAVASIEGNDRLREPQRDAHRAIREHFETSKESAILQIPVGCGKTGVIATLPFGVAVGRVLVIAPNTTIRKGVSEALDITSAKCFWNKARVLASVSQGPYCAVLDGPDANLHDCTESHFVVTNIQQLASSADRWLPQFPPGFFDMILVDEGHHNVADSWRKVYERFPDAKVVSLTATPFRSDGQPLVGNIVYRYSYAKAMINGYIKEIHSVNVAPSEIYFTYKDDVRHHTLEEVMQLREESWFRRGVALAPECNKHIAEASVLRCVSLRNKTGLKHQIIAAACSVDHARQIRAIYEQLGLEAREIYSEMEADEKEAVLSELASGKLDCIVQVQMLGEGFDHPQLSVAAVFRPFRSLSPYIQFVGRVMRVIHENDPGHPDNHGYVVSHVGLNNDANWRDFREVDYDDQVIFRRWIATNDANNEPESGSGEPRRFDLGMRVDNEIISHFIGQSFLNPEDDRVIDELLNQKVPGTPFTLANFTSKEKLREMLRERQKEHDQKPQDLPVQPQKKRQATRKRLAERTNSVVARILQELKLAMGGREIAPACGLGIGDNRRAVTVLLQREVNECVGIKSRQRREMSLEQAQKAFDQLDALGDKVRDAVRAKLRGKHG
jgi:DNA repair protein RadD